MLYTSGQVDCLPHEVDYDTSRIEVLNNHFQKLIEQKKIQGASYCISRYGKIFGQGALGSISYKDANTPLLPTTVHRIASITKAIVTVAIAKLVEDGMIRFDDPVGSILKQFNVPPFNQIDIYSLLTHTSGLVPEHLTYHRSYWELIQQYFDSYKAEDGELDWISAALSGGVNKNVGEEWQYNTFGFCILGEVIKQVTGMSEEQYIEEHIAKPLGMKDTMFNPTPDLAKRCIIRNEEEERYYHDLIAGQNPELSSSEKLWSHVSNTGGGLYSTQADLITFANMLLGMGKLNNISILGRKVVEKITTRTLYNIPDYCWGANNPDRSYGIGLDMRRGPGFLYSPSTYGHEGSGACSMIIDPTEQLAAVWFVPFTDNDWHADALFNVTNIIWSGLN
jgi:CubicO group peptidase (beta-lactamase class C family)